MNDDSEETESDDGDDFTHPNLSTYKADDQEEEEEKANDAEVSFDQRVNTPPDYQLTDEEEHHEGDNKVKKATQDTEDAHVTLTVVPPVVQQQSSSVSPDLVSKYINPSSDAGIDSILNQDTKPDFLINVPISVAVKTPSYVTTIPQPPNLNVQPQQQTPISTTTTTNPTMPLLDIPIFASLFQFDQRVSALETEMPEVKQTNQFAEAVSSIPGIVDSRSRSTNQPQTPYAVATSLSESKLKKILIDKMKTNKSMNKSDIQKHLYIALVESYNTEKDIMDSYGKSTHTEEHGQKVDDLEDQLHQEFNTRNDDVAPNEQGRQVIPFDHFINNDLEYLKGESSSQRYTTSITKTKAAVYGQVKWIEDKIYRIWSLVKVVYDRHAYWGTYHWGPKRQKFYGYASNMETSKDVYSRHKIIVVTSLKIMECFGYSHLEEIVVRRRDDHLYKFRECDFKRLHRQDIKDMSLLFVQDKLNNLNLEERYQKKINLKRPDTYGSDLRSMTTYTAYPDIQGIIYEDEMNTKRLMRTDEFHKFSDGTLNHVCTALNDIALGIEMDYLPKRKWSKQDKQRARVMINAIDKKLRDRRLMRNLEKFVGGRPYGGDLRLLERTI
ncbi:hypothetical protein Tco_1116705 [Tanacetum coccineum]